MEEAYRDSRGLERCPWGCGQVVRRTTTQRGRRMYVDPDPVRSTRYEDGNAAAYLDGVGTWRSRRLGQSEQPAHLEKRFMPHIATCRSERRPQAPPGELPAGVILLDTVRARRRGSRPT